MYEVAIIFDRFTHSLKLELKLKFLEKKMKTKKYNTTLEYMYTIKTQENSTKLKSKVMRLISFKKTCFIIERQNFCAKIVQNTLVCSYSLNMFHLWTMMRAKDIN